MTDLDVSRFVGLDERDSKDLAASLGLVTRLVKLDGYALVVTRDYRTDRVNLEVSRELVIGAYVG